MKLSLNKQERNEILMDILCNGGISYLASSGIEMDYIRAEYKSTKKEGDCFEDVLIRMINNGMKINFFDVECDGEYSKTLDKNVLKNALTNVKDKNFMDYISQSLNEQSDAETGYCLIQYILYNELIFG